MIMTAIEEQLQKIKAQNRLGLMTHIVVGYPNLEESRRLVLAMAEAGADFIELQIPFSDPVADGPTLMRANQESLKQGTTVAQAMQLMGELAAATPIPLLFMTYFNIVFRYGVERFCQDAQQAGCAGLIVPDIPIEEEHREHFILRAKQSRLSVIRVISPASTERRLRLNAQHAEGFVYFVSRKGVTGAQANLDAELAQNLQKIRQYISLPIAVGFGISQPEHIVAIKGTADIA